MIGSHSPPSGRRLRSHNLPRSHHPVLSYHLHCCLHGIECLRTDKSDIDNKDLNQLAAQCGSVPAHSILVVVWASLIQIIMINTSAVVAVDDREGGSMGPPFELLVKGVWTFYLGISYIIPWINTDRALTPGTYLILPLKWCLLLSYVLKWYSNIIHFKRHCNPLLSDAIPILFLGT